MYSPKYSIDSDMLNAISEIAEIKVVVERSKVLPMSELELKRQALIRMVHTSTSIEGNKLAQYQVDKVLSGASISGDEQSIKEVKNYQDAIRQVENLASKKTRLTLDLILKLHKITMKDLVDDGKLGKFRPGEIYVVDDLGDGREHLRYKGPDIKDVEKLMNDLISWYNKSSTSTLHPIIKAGILHLQFVSIHPFTDGNGRLARLLTTLSLYLDGWDFRKIIVLEEFYNKNRQDYYNAENVVQGGKYQEGQDITPWLEYFIAGFLIEARKVRKIISSLGFDKIKADSQMFLDADEIKIMDFLVSSFKITSDDVVKILGVAKRTAQLKLKGLTDKKLIKPEGKGPSTYYVLRD